MSTGSSLSLFVVPADTLPLRPIAVHMIPDVVEFYANNRPPGRATISRPHRLHAVHEMLPIVTDGGARSVSLCICLLVTHVHELYKNGWTDRVVEIWAIDSGTVDPRNPADRSAQRIASYGNQTISSTWPSRRIQISTVGVNQQLSNDHQKFMKLSGELSWQRLRRSAVGAHQNLNGSRDLTTPHGWFATHGLALATVNLYLPTLKSSTPLTTKIWKAIQNVETGVVRGS